MMYQQNTQGKQPTNEFFGTRTQVKQGIMPSALLLYLGSCPFIQLFSCSDRKRAHGIEPEEEDQVNIMPVLCPICKTPNNHDQKICQSCAKPLTTEMAVLLNEEKDDKIEKLEKSVESLTTLMLPILELVNSTKPLKIPMSSLPKSVQQQLEKKLNQK